jgi:hypothetical protein
VKQVRNLWSLPSVLQVVHDLVRAVAELHTRGLFDPNFNIVNVKYVACAEQRDLCVLLENLLDWEKLPLTPPQDGK